MWHAAGTLPPGRSLLVAVDFPFCPHAGGRPARRGDGWRVPRGIARRRSGGGSLSRTLARLDVPAAEADPTAEHILLSPGLLSPGLALPEVLRGLMRPNSRWMAPGVSRIAPEVPRHVPARAAAAAARATPGWCGCTPGTSLPDHGHRGWEATCVLAGSFTDASGTYRPGDVAETDGSVIHPPLANPTSTVFA